MNTYQKGFASVILILAVLVIAGAGVWWAMQSTRQPDIQQPAVAPTANEQKTDTPIQQANLSTEEMIRKALIATTNDPKRQKSYEQVEISVELSGERYVLFQQVTYTTFAGPTAQILDKQAQKIIGSLPAGGITDVSQGRIVVSDQDVCYYGINQPACKPIEGAKLLGNDTYDPNGEEVYPYLLADIQKTNTSFTISVFDKKTQPKSEAEYNAGIKAKKIRELTFQLPQ